MSHLVRIVTVLSALPLLSAVMACADPLTYDFISKDAPIATITLAPPVSPAAPTFKLDSVAVKSSPLIAEGDLATENIDFSDMTATGEEVTASATIAKFISSVPEPSSLALLGTGVLAMCFEMKRSSRSRGTEV
jgi:hypothetical protein